MREFTPMDEKEQGLLTFTCSPKKASISVRICSNKAGGRSAAPLQSATSGWIYIMLRFWLRGTVYWLPLYSRKVCGTPFSLPDSQSPTWIVGIKYAISFADLISAASYFCVFWSTFPTASVLFRDLNLASFLLTV